MTLVQRMAAEKQAAFDIGLQNADCPADEARHR